MSDGIENTNLVLGWTGATDVTVLLALYLFKRYIGLYTEVKDEIKDLMRTGKQVPCHIAARYRALAAFRPPNVDTTCGEDVATYIQRILTLGIITAEFYLQRRIPCDDEDRW